MLKRSSKKNLDQMIHIQSQSMDVYFIFSVFQWILEFSLLLGCAYGFLMLFVEL
ncbi:hypothetical protein JOC73_001052 [Alkaliphilus hydrothermalis]|uniref:Uncharacterized protein n=1 Tax=Alkaliphilus hydrothermalis TaxID=1482730 RepID=A0ABS2NNL9_9FIRM|nr:hypothetical protein [Alkaliphilus hydrothermalis]